jgi:hypothetical protein
VVEEGVRRLMDKVDIGLIVAAALALGLTALPSGTLGTVAGVMAGALISLVVARLYYRRAGEELRREAERLRRESEELHLIAMRMLQSTSGGHRVEVLQDEQGRPTGVGHHVSIHNSVEVADQATSKTYSDTEQETSVEEPEDRDH